MRPRPYLRSLAILLLFGGWSCASTGTAPLPPPAAAPPAAPAARPEPPPGRAPAPADAPEQAGEGQEEREAPPRPERAGPPQPRPYERVITKEAKSDPGVFTVHQLNEKIYYEIPPSELDKDFLWVSQIKKTTIGVGYGGQALGNRVVRWERRGNRVLLRSVSYDVFADPGLPIAQAVDASNNASIIMAFNVEAFGTDDAPVIDVTRLFTTDVAEFSPRQRLRASGFDASRTFVDRVVSFPENINVDVQRTYTLQPSPTGGRQGGPPTPAQPPGMRPGSATVVMAYSMVKLPEQPMMPRLFDERVGYFTHRQMDYGRDSHKAEQRAYIARYRLEKRDPSAAISEPVRPIVYYVDPATPKKWVDSVKRGIEQWQPAFEEAGFRLGIIAKEAPSPEEDPDWSPEDARYSVIRWLPSTIQNASGPHISDPRTGEIIEADIQFYHNVMNLTRDWYFVQVGPIDPRAKRLPLPDDLMGVLIEYVVAHEVGHTLGFQHNMKASSQYSLEQVRDREWVKDMGHTPTLMDYSRFNYVAQPEDNIDIADLVPKIGPYDKWATMWGYKPIPGARTPDEEKKTLDEWARAQDTTPWLRFTTAGAGSSDPGNLTEAVGDANAVEATRLGVKNLERVTDMLLEATVAPGEPWDDLTELHTRILAQWATEMNHVAALVGGFHSQQKHGGQAGVRFEPVPRDAQAGAVTFLNDQAFHTPAFLIEPELLRRMEPSGVMARVKASQKRALTSLLNNARFDRLVEQAAIDGAAYTPVQFLEDLRTGIWSELSTRRFTIDAFRRNTQRAYLEVMGDTLNGRNAADDDLRAFARGGLQALDARLRAVAGNADNAETRMHIADARDQIAKMLDPKFPPAAPPPATGGVGGDVGVDTYDTETGAWSLGCWQDPMMELLTSLPTLRR